MSNFSETAMLENAPGKMFDAKKRRNRLFRKGRPNVRRLEILDGEQYTKDMGRLWVAYREGSFNLPADLTQEEFLEAVEGMQKEYNQLWVIDDVSDAYPEGSGPVAMVGTKLNGLLITADGMPFKWATRRNALKCAVSFLHMITHSVATGVVFVRGTKESSKFWQHLKPYRLLFPLGRIGKDEFLFYVRGRGGV